MHHVVSLRRLTLGAAVQGHGPCDDYSRSVTVSRFIAATSEIAKEAKALLRMLGIPARELRGVGLSVSHTSCPAPRHLEGPSRLPGVRQLCTATLVS